MRIAFAGVSLAALPAGERVDLVDVFRRPDALPTLVPAVAALDPRLLWLQLGVMHAEAEAAALDVADLYQAYEGFPALEVRHGKGDKQRMVLYGELEWCLDPVQLWL